MAKVLLTADDLSRVFDQSIEELQKGRSAKLSELPMIVHVLGQARDDHVLRLCAPPLSDYISEISLFRQFLLLPILEPTGKSSYQEILDNAIERGADSLNTLKQELCRDGNCDHSSILSSLGELVKQSHTLYSERQIVMRQARPQGHAEEE